MRLGKKKRLGSGFTRSNRLVAVFLGYIAVLFQNYRARPFGMVVVVVVSKWSGVQLFSMGNFCAFAIPFVSSPLSCLNARYKYRIVSIFFKHLYDGVARSELCSVTTTPPGHRKVVVVMMILELQNVFRTNSKQIRGALVISGTGLTPFYDAFHTDSK